MVKHGLVILGKQFGVENVDQVRQDDVGLNGRNLIIRGLLHVAIDDMAVFECLEQSVTRFG